MSLAVELLTVVEWLATLTGVAYVVLAARRNRLCWVAGAASSALMGAVFFQRNLPMQAGLQVFYVGMSVYGWLSWTRAAGEGELPVGSWPWHYHVMAGALAAAVSWITAHWLAQGAKSDWPLLDSLTTWFSLVATWLVARARIENWIYWIIIDGVLVFLCYKQELPWMALLNVFLIVVAAAGFVSWRRRLLTQGAPT